MSNPYTVSLSLSGFDELLWLDEKNNVHIEAAEKRDPNRQRVFELAKKIWIKEFHMSENDVNKAPLGKSTIVVMCSNDDKGNSNPVSAARFEIYEDPDTHVKTAKLYSMASIVKKRGYGKLLLDKISKFVKKRCDCNFMTVDVVRPIISHFENITMFMSDPTEKKNWALETPTPHEIAEQDRDMREYYEFQTHEIIVSPRQVENLEKLKDELNLDDETRLVCRNIQSMKRTQRVQGLLDFYKRCNFTFQITPGDNSEYQVTYSTPWGDIWPFYSYTLVANLYKTDNASVTDNIKRLSEWQDYNALQENYDRY
jgi:hypothetical protein